MTSKVYLDSSVLIDWHTVEDVENLTDPLSLFATESLMSQANSAVRDLLRAEKRLTQVAKLRHDYLRSETPIARLVTSPIAVSELLEWHAEVSLKQMVVDSAGPHILQRKSKKDIGNLFAGLWRLAESQPAANAALCAATLAGSFIVSHACRGVSIEDLTAFSFSLSDALGRAHRLAIFQLGAADIVHVLAANHLGCTHIVSFDQDFARVRESLSEDFGLIVLTSIEELRGLLLPT